MKIGVFLLIVILRHLLNMAASKNRLSWVQTWVSLSRSTEWGPIFWTQNLPDIHNLNLLLLSEGSKHLALQLLRQRLQCSCPWKSALGPPALPGLLPMQVPFSISSVMDSIWKKTSSSWGSWDKKRGCWYFNLQNKLAKLIFPSILTSVAGPRPLLWSQHLQQPGCENGKSKRHCDKNLSGCPSPPRTYIKLGS